MRFSLSLLIDGYRLGRTPVCDLVHSVGIVPGAVLLEQNHKALVVVLAEHVRQAQQALPRTDAPLTINGDLHGTSSERIHDYYSMILLRL
jgi:hypothetical protein